MLALHVDDSLWLGDKNFTDTVIRRFSAHFKVGAVKSTDFVFLGMRIHAHFSADSMTTIEVSQVAYLEAMTPPIYDNRRPPDTPLSTEEHTEYRRVVGELLWASQLTRPDLAFRVHDLSVHLQAPTTNCMRMANRLLNSAKTVRVSLWFPCITGSLVPKLKSFSDAAFGGGPASTSVAGMFIFLAFDCGSVHPILWRSYKIKRVVRSTLAGETLGVADTIDRVFMIKTIASKIWNVAIQSHIYTDCMSLVDCVYEHKQCTEKRLLIEIHLIRNLIDIHEIDTLTWVDTHMQLADCLQNA
jgi:hypothetical protein